MATRYARRTRVCPLVLSDTPVEITSSPLLGQHNEEILNEIGWDGTYIRRLMKRAAGAGATSGRAGEPT